MMTVVAVALLKKVKEKIISWKRKNITLEGIILCSREMIEKLEKKGLMDTISPKIEIE